MNGPTGVAPLKTSRNSASVGLKVNFGGQVSADASGLNAVRNIHRIGRKKAMPTTQPSTVQPASPVISRTRRLRLGARTGARASAAGRVGRVMARHCASSNWKTRANSRSAKLATMIVSTTVTTPAAADPPISKA